MLKRLIESLKSNPLVEGIVLEEEIYGYLKGTGLEKRCILHIIYNDDVKYLQKVTKSDFFKNTRALEYGIDHLYGKKRWYYEENNIEAAEEAASEIERLGSTSSGVFELENKEFKRQLQSHNDDLDLIIDYFEKKIGKNIKINKTKLHSFHTNDDELESKDTINTKCHILFDRFDGISLYTDKDIENSRHLVFKGHKGHIR